MSLLVPDYIARDIPLSSRQRKVIRKEAWKLRREYGIDVAQTILGHRLGSSVTEVYAEANQRRAREVVSKVG